MKFIKFPRKTSLTIHRKMTNSLLLWIDFLQLTSHKCDSLLTFRRDQVSYN